MAAWRVAPDSRRGQQDLLCGQCFRTRQICGRTRATNSEHPRECLAGESCSTEGLRQGRLCFLDQTLCWDLRQQQKSSRSPDLRYKESHELLWLNNFYKPVWVDAQLATLQSRRAPTDKWSILDYPDHRRPVRHERGLSAETVSKLCQQGQLSDAVEALEVLVQNDPRVSKSLFYTVLKQCVATKDLVLGRRVHNLTVKMGYDLDPFLCNHILRMYASHARLQEAMNVFTVVPKPDVFMWSSIISAHVRHGQAKQAIQLYHQMRSSGGQPDGHVFVAALQACTSGADLKTGQQVHADVLNSGVEPDVHVCSCLVDMYAKCGSLEDAQRVFDGSPRKNVVTWTAMIAGYSHKGRGQEALRLYSAMQQEGIAAPDSVTYVCLLQACASVGITAIEMGKQLHAQIEERGLQAHVGVLASLINMYAKCGSFEDAQGLFNGISRKTVVAWNAMITGYVQHGLGQEALHLYSAMEQEGITAPDSVTFVCLLQACASVGNTAMGKGKYIHSQIEEQGLQADVGVGSSLVNMYVKCGSLKDAQSVFDRICRKDVLTWTAMIAGYSQEGMGEEALRLYSAMQQECIVAPNSVTFVCLLQACASVGMLALEKGKQLHAQIEEQGLQADVVIGGSLVNMYAKCGSLEDAHRVFDRTSQKTVVTWTALIAGYIQQGMGQEALSLYSRMQQEGITAPDLVTFVCLLQACASVGIMALEIGKKLHAQIEEQGLQVHVGVGSSLVNMYAKCGSLKDAQRVFDGLRQKDLLAWTAMIAAYSQQGLGQEALHLYSVMQQLDIIVPDSVTFVCLLQACANMAALRPGRQLHAEIEEQGLQADVFVANSLINMYAKSGSMVDAQHVFDALPERDIVGWNALIAGYTRQGDSEAVFDLVHRMRKDGLEPNGVTFLSVLTVCSHAGLVDKGRVCFEVMPTEYTITPNLEHYTCLVDLLSRAGHLDEALEVARTMPLQPDSALWRTLLGACRKWGNVEVGRHAFDEAVRLDEIDAAPYVLMCAIYTDGHMWEEAQEMQARRKGIWEWKQPGQRWLTDVCGDLHEFVVGDEKHPESNGLAAAVKTTPVPSFGHPIRP